MDIMTNSEEPYVMPHIAAFYLGLHSMIRQNQSSEKETRNVFENYNPRPLPQYIQWTIQTFLNVSLWYIPLVLKGVK